MTTTRSRFSRRDALRLGAAAGVGAVVGGGVVSAFMAPRSAEPKSEPTPQERATVEWWRRSRRPPYFIGHRGAGAVLPEHTLPGYEKAIEWGGQCLELAVVLSSDGVPFCLQDLTLNRTTTLQGPADRYNAAGLDKARVNIPRLGPRWTGPNMPKLPRLAEVLDAVGGRAVLCLEATNEKAFPAMIAAVRRAGLQDTAVIKLPAGSRWLPVTKRAKLPVVAYLADFRRITAATIDALGRNLDPDTDAIELPAHAGEDFFSTDLIRRAVDTGLPVWVAPVFRRFEIQHFSRLGVEGIVTPDLGYLSGSVPPRKTDDWPSGGLSPGELTKEPYSNAYAVEWMDEGVIGIDFPRRPSFVTLGQFCPIVAESYRLTFDARFNPLPVDTWQHLSIAFGHRDDRYYEHRLASADGYHAQLRADGSMAIYAHVEGDPNGVLLTATQASTPLRSGEWLRMTLDVTPELLRWSRDDGTYVESKDRRFRGGYLHVGRSENDGGLELRNMAIA